SMKSPESLRPRRRVRRKSPPVLIRWAFASTGCYAESFVRPLRRRAAMIDRPARVRMRRRKPWTFARRRLFGWNVLLLMMSFGWLIHAVNCAQAVEPQKGMAVRDRSQPIKAMG